MTFSHLPVCANESHLGQIGVAVGRVPVEIPPRQPGMLERVTGIKRSKYYDKNHFLMTTNLSIIIVIHHRCIFIPEAIMAHQRNANLERMHGACAYDASRSISNVPHTHNQTHIQTAIAVYFFYFSFCFVHNTLVMVGGCCWFSFPFCRNSSTSSFLFFFALFKRK